MVARILVVDNSESMRILFTMCLKAAGWEVFTYDYAHIGLSSLQQLQPDLILLDFNVRDGGASWEFLQVLKMEDMTAHIPILITTTLGVFSPEIQNYLLTRYINVVHKPFDLDTLLLLIQQTLTLAS